MNLANRSAKTRTAVTSLWGKGAEKGDWYSIQSAGDVAEIMIFDVIGWPYVGADQFARDLADIKAKNILVRINSPGGDVFDGMAIFNALRNHGASITTRVEGLAASMASVIAMAGDVVTGYENTMFMIHNPWTFASGDSREFRHVADVLDKTTDQIASVYAAKIGGDVEAVKKMMGNETWFTADEAKENGFFDEVLTEKSVKKAQNRFDLSIFQHAPTMDGEGDNTQVADAVQRLTDIYRRFSK